MKKRQYLATVFFVLLTLFSIAITAEAASWPSVSSRNYCEFVSKKTIYVYKDTACRTRGTSSPSKKYNAYIAKNDVCYVYKFTNNYLQVSYPTSSGRNVGYIKRSDFTENENITQPTELISASGKVTTYKYYGGAYYGYTERGDAVYALGAVGDYTAIIYSAKSGYRAYKYALVRTSDYINIIKDEGGDDDEPSDPELVTTESYKTYTGVNYTNIINNADMSLKEKKNRITVLDEARKMATIIWSPAVSFHTWRGSDLSYNSNQRMRVSGRTSSNYYFVKGCSYVGIPYAANAGYNKYNVAGWLSLLNNKGSGKSTFEGTVKYLGITRSNCTFRGVDCSGFVYNSYNRLRQYDLDYLSTSELLDSAYWKRISSSIAQPGDILLKTGHVMIYAGKTESGKVAVFESVADGENGISGCRYAERSSISGYNYYKYINIAI